MKIAPILAPVARVDATIEAARLADALGFDAIGLWDHYHSAKPEWGYIAGWSAMTSLAANTERINLVQMVVNNLHFEVGVVAKETSTLALLSNGRYELGIGAGDWPESFSAWGRTFPHREERVARLAESVDILRKAWSGGAFDFDGDFETLRGACVSPVPGRAPRVVVGVAKSRSLLESAVAYADELNLYADPVIVESAAALVAQSGRDVTLSLFCDWSWSSWPADPQAELEPWRQRGIDRFFVSIGGDDMPARLEKLAPLLQA
jgi:alkanesulfonate monooxygenase SsuD/methylene tetrahydromethanopterin reductase-like flavin-dependent oxidoreductase (luciferase family)